MKKSKSKSKKSAPLICALCGATAARVVRRPQVLGKGAQLTLVENVPVVSCQRCGETYLTAETMHELDRIRLNRDRLSVRRQVAVAKFSGELVSRPK
jgi:YgiT-type zinc finger domain-containing protein